MTVSEECTFTVTIRYFHAMVDVGAGGSARVGLGSVVQSLLQENSHLQCRFMEQSVRVQDLLSASHRSTMFSEQFEAGVADGRRLCFTAHCPVSASICVQCARPTTAEEMACKDSMYRLVHTYGQGRGMFGGVSQ